MSDFILYQQMLPAPELIIAMTGANVLVGTLLHAPIKIIFDNQSTAPVVLFTSFDGINFVQWKTFAGGEALVLDDDLYTFPKNMMFYGNGASSGSFSISYTYVNNF